MTLVRFDVDGEIGTVTLNRPDKLNALSPELAGELVDVLKAAATNDRVRALVITGAGRAFCAGGDIETMRRLLNEQDWTSVRGLIVAGATVVTGGGLTELAGPPIEQVKIERLTLPQPGVIQVEVVNDGYCRLRSLD
jgi:enoyl-CoA hydratase/carnithine racemase